MFEDIEFEPTEDDLKEMVRHLSDNIDEMKDHIGDMESEKIVTDRKLAEYIIDCENFAKLFKGIRNRAKKKDEFDEMIKDVADEMEINDFLKGYQDDEN